MAIDYQSSFNSGELSGRMNGRSGLEVYGNGCSRLENFFVLPQGGIERRTGTEFIENTASELSYDAWVTATDYTIGEYVTESLINYRCITEHTSSASFATDSANWYALPLAGTNAVRLIPFVFSSSQSYAVEVGDGYIKMWDGNTSYDVTGDVPYGASDLAEIKFVQRFDILYLSHPDYSIRRLKRVTLTPEFEIDEFQYIYPPAIENERDDIGITPDGTTGSITLTSSEDLFFPGHVGGYFVLKHKRGEGASESGYLTTKPSTSKTLDVSGEYYGASCSGLGYALLQKNVAGGGWVDIGPGNPNLSWTYSSDAPALADTLIRIRLVDLAGTVYYSLYSEEASTIHDSGITGSNTTSTVLDVSYSKWNVNTGGSWNGKVVIERSVDGGAWEDFLIIGDTRGVEKINFNYATPSEERRDVRIKLVYSGGSGTFGYNIYSEAPYKTGIVKITDYTSATEVTADVISELGIAAQTLIWEEGAFSDLRGHPRAIAFNEDRFWLAGNNVEPSTIYSSVSGDYDSFLPGSTDDMGIRRIPDSPELAQWLIGKNKLILGTEGGAIAVRSVNRDELISASNIVTNAQAVFGASTIDAIEANDIVAYTERSGKKLRELIYSDDEQNYRSSDLNILNNEILNPMVSELFLQKQPDQIIWAVLEDGTMAHLTYERVQEVIGWGRFITNGEVKSACRIPNANLEDEIWMCVNRNGIYTIERSKPRADADWYVDSGVEAITGLDHLEGLEVRCLVDGVNDGVYTVSSGEITPTTSGSAYLVGLDYDSIMRTMPIEPNLMNKLPNSRIKGAVKCTAEFYPTTGGSIREKNKTGEIFDEVEFSGEKKFNIASDWTREKIIEIKQHLPYPMTILSLAVWTEAKGG